MPLLGTRVSESAVRAAVGSGLGSAVSGAPAGQGGEEDATLVSSSISTAAHVDLHCCTVLH